MSCVFGHNSTDVHEQNYELAKAVTNIDVIGLYPAIGNSTVNKRSLTWDQINYKYNTDNWFRQSKIHLVYSCRVNSI